MSAMTKRFGGAAVVAGIAGFTLSIVMPYFLVRCDSVWDLIFGYC